ncbi:TPA: zf-HC2 domain-containing protein [Candidatus Poribacteria bacterium]|nr:zf-HC2 domain-containing protein [Candidatus Poribacteria bacterium]
MLKCEDIRPQLSAYIDRETPLWEAQMIRWHLRRCHECAFEYMLLTDASEAMKSYLSVTTSDNFLDEVITKASIMVVYERQELNFLQRVIRRIEARFARLQYIFHVFRGKAAIYATALMTLVILGYFVSVMPKIFTPPLTGARQMFVKAEVNSSKDIIPVEFVTPERLRYIQGR